MATNHWTTLSAALVAIRRALRHQVVTSNATRTSQLWDTTKREISTCPYAVGMSPILVFDCR